MDLWVLVLIYFLAVMRITRLINFDQIMYWLHNVVGNKWGPASWQAEFIECPWCVSMWVGLLTAWFPIWLAGWTWWSYVPVAMAASMVVGLFAFHTSEETAMEPEEQHQSRLP